MIFDWQNFTPVSATLGGVFIGLAAVWLMASIGRIAGVSGIVGGLARAGKTDRVWRMAFIIGLIAAPLLVGRVKPELLQPSFPTTGVLLACAGLLVGVGTTFGNGCTSGHGVCGNARLSQRSIVATLSFMIAGIATVAIKGMLA